ncbi:hypothetical protein [Thermomonospora umbrina]|uniref:Uncharacterized protein n=1 Tax=Thermomonospora umbrina TaxID=111806 RepID=A0A3D9SZ03_9ACTN|nr:hypothetical protein [Thermomonospora umbrina]REE97804.1 hypothetical protein DFJ69_3279 [Thermomonospora umbrina]
MTRRLIVGVVMAAVAGLSAAGCSGSDDKKPELGPDVAWAGKVCELVGKNVGSLMPPTFSNPNDPKAKKAGYLKFLNDLSSRLTALESTLTTAGAPPVTGGQQALDKALQNLRTAKVGVAKATVAMNRAQTTNVRTFEKSVAGLNQAMQAYATYEGPVKDLRSNRQISDAFNRSSTCVSQKL